MKLKTILLSVVMFSLFAMFAVAENPQKINSTEGRKILTSGEKVVLVDVRTKSEYEESHIPTAILIPNETISTKRPAELSDLNAKIIVYCRSGRRSADAARKLVKMGYTNVIDLGGIISWQYEKISGSIPGEF